MRRWRRRLPRVLLVSPLWRCTPPKSDEVSSLQSPNFALQRAEGDGRSTTNDKWPAYQQMAANGSVFISGLRSRQSVGLWRWQSDNHAVVHMHAIRHSLAVRNVVNHGHLAGTGAWTAHSPGRHRACWNQYYLEGLIRHTSPRHMEIAHWIKRKAVCVCFLLILDPQFDASFIIAGGMKVGRRG